ncbi:hypothetical protein D3C81_1890430 [compost metagenome]
MDRLGLHRAGYGAQQLRLMGRHAVEHCHEGLVFRAVLPVRPGADIIEDGCRVDIAVEVGLVRVDAVVAGLAQVLGPGADDLRQRSFRTHVIGRGVALGMHAGQDGEA